MNQVTVRKAIESDFPQLLALYQTAIGRMQSLGIDQWDELYPNAEVIRDDIANGHSYVLTIGDQIASAFALNHSCDPEYADGNWEYPAASYIVVHRLCVNPPFQHQGIGAKTMLAVESIAKGMGVEAVRLDAFSLNPYARKLYSRLGYSEAGTIRLRKGQFILLEKKL
jgi:GNAT superfamily N-acetyltransferase